MLLELCCVGVVLPVVVVVLRCWCCFGTDLLLCRCGADLFFLTVLLCSCSDLCNTVPPTLVGWTEAQLLLH